jgi:hypothetical protein
MFMYGYIAQGIDSTEVLCGIAYFANFAQFTCPALLLVLYLWCLTQCL